MFKFGLRVLLLLILLSSAGQAQIASARNRNNPYSPSPDRQSKSVEIGPVETDRIVAVSTASVPVPIPAKRPNAPIVEPPVPLTDLYKVGIGDVLLIELANVSQGHGYYTVRPEGTIDYQLAGGDVIVADKSPAAIARELANRITLFPDPEVQVTVREYGSHKITVMGLVDHPGEKSLQREAMPMFVIMAEAGIKLNAGSAIVTRAPLLKAETYLLKDKATDDVLIYPGNSVEFVAGPNDSHSVYFIAGNVANGGQRDLAPGQTLYQAIASAGGLRGSPRKVVIRRKDDKGLLSVATFDLRSIRDGKTADPRLMAGDVIEIGK